MAKNQKKIKSYQKIELKNCRVKKNKIGNSFIIEHEIKGFLAD